jgi:predicted MFS family arabinose efflux permease
MLGDDSGKSPSLPSKPSSSSLVPSSHKRSIISFCITTFLFWAALYLYVPILPVYIQATGASLSLVGLVVAAYAIPQVLLRIPIGLLSDSLKRRKPLVVLGLITVAIGALWLGLSDDPWLLFFARMTTGVSAATWVVFVVYFAAYYPANNQERAIGLINFVLGIALVAATAGGGVIAAVMGARQTFFIAALLAVIGIFPLIFAKENQPPKVVTSIWRGFSSVIVNPMLITVSIMGILNQFSNFAGLFAFTPIYATQIGASITDLGLITMINMGFCSLGSLAALWISKKFGHRVTVIWGASLIGGSLLAVPFIEQVPVLMASQISFGLGRGVLMTILMTLSIRNVAPECQATAMGVYQAVYAVGMLLGPLVSGIIAENIGLSAVFPIAALPSLLIIPLSFLPVFSRHTTV